MVSIFYIILNIEFFEEEKEEKPAEVSKEADTSLDIKNFDIGDWDFDAAGNYVINNNNKDIILKILYDD